MTTERINYQCVVDALIARFDKEVSVEEHEMRKNVLNSNDRNLYYELSSRMGSGEIDVIITTANSRKAKTDRESLAKLFGD